MNRTQMKPKKRAHIRTLRDRAERDRDGQWPSKALREYRRKRREQRRRERLAIRRSR